jgi:hypothetical protein
MQDSAICPFMIGPNEHLERGIMLQVRNECSKRRQFEGGLHGCYAHLLARYQ